MDGTLAGTGTSLGVYEAAWLAGGPGRVVDTAVVALVRSGRVRAPAPGELVVVAPARRDPVEAAVLDAIGTVGHRSPDTVRWRAVADPRLTDLARRLGEQGLLRRRGVRAGRRRDGVPPGAPTRAGRRLLARLRAAHPADDVWRVALEGPGAVQDERLRASVAAPPQAPADVSRRAVREARRDLAAADPAAAARRTGVHAAGGAGALGFLPALGPGDGGGGGDG